MKIFRKYIQKAKGFSLTEVMIGGAVVAGLGLVVAKLSTQSIQNQRIANANFAVMEMTARIQTIVSNETSCLNSLGGTNLSLGASTLVSPLRDRNNAVAYEAGNTTYLDGQVSLPSMTLTRRSGSSVLRVIMRRHKSTVDPSANTNSTVARDFFINANWDSAGVLESCSSDISNFKETVKSHTLQAACGGATPLPGMAFFEGDADTTEDDTCEALPQLGDPAELAALAIPESLDCPGEQAYAELAYDASQGRYIKVCKDIYKIPKCEPNEVLTRYEDGSDYRMFCVDMNCGSNGILKGITRDANNKPVADCFICANTGEIPVFNQNTNQWDCKRPQCANNAYFAGFSSNGDPICKNLVEGDNCSSGFQLISTSGGQVKLDCCTPVCPDPGSVCAGAPYESSNGCGICTGTKQPVCENAANYCQGTVFASSNGCGFCQGTRPQINDRWSDWTATEQYRAKPGASCSEECGGGEVVRQRKYVKTCIVGSCGGASCPVEPSEKWEDEGTMACNTEACEEPGCDNEYKYPGYGTGVQSYCWKDQGGGCGQRNIVVCQVGACGKSNGKGCKLGDMQIGSFGNWSKTRACSGYSVTQGQNCNSTWESLPPCPSRCDHVKAEDVCGGEIYWYRDQCNSAGNFGQGDCVLTGTSPIKYPGPGCLYNYCQYDNDCRVMRKGQPNGNSSANCRDKIKCTCRANSGSSSGGYGGGGGYEPMSCVDDYNECQDMQDMYGDQFTCTLY